VSTNTATGILLIAVPVAFNASFAGLAARFDYPDILRRPTDEILARFRAGGTRLVLLWWAFAASAVVFAPLVVLLASVSEGADGALLAVGATIGVLAAVVQFLGLIRWPFLVPYLARLAADPDTTPARREAVDVVFGAFHRYLGVAVGEHLGYGLTGAWSVLAGAALVQSSAVASWLGIAGIVIGPLLLLCSFEFLGRVEPAGWKLAGRLTPFVYVAWSLWLMATGVALLT
jgi:Na+-transporting NADH:ubiquinone oxidoreductase subunit NqrB